MTARMAATGLVAALLAAGIPVVPPASAAIPFLTDDAEPLGKGTAQVELWYTGSTDRERLDGFAARTSRNLPGATFGYGAAEPLDLTLGVAREWGKVTFDGASSNDPGSVLSTLSAKWQFHETGTSGLHFAVKPLAGYSVPVGGRGGERTVTLGGWIIATAERGPLAVSMNVGYLHNDYGSAADRNARRSGNWTVTALATYEISKGWKVGCDIGVSSSPERADSTIPSYALAGAIYTLNRKVELGLGLKFGITDPEPDFAGTAGITIRF